MKIRKQTFSLDMYLKQLRAETIRTDQECQRLSGQWKPNMIGELIATVLTDNYIPPIILGEETVNGITRQWIIDGLQRSTSFHYSAMRIPKSQKALMNIWSPTSGRFRTKTEISSGMETAKSFGKA